MVNFMITEGEGRTRISLLAQDMGIENVVSIYNENPHIGAVALGEYDTENERSSVSLITRLGHKDDSLAQKAAYLISKRLKRPVCVIAGVHVDNITGAEIAKILENSSLAIEKFITCKQGSKSA
jgi:gallate decarboxylase subunit D